MPSQLLAVEISCAPNHQLGGLIPPPESHGGSIEYDDDNVPPVIEQITVEDIPQDSTRFYRSHTKIVSVPNGVKIITTILANDNVSPGDEFGTVYETLIFPESEIIRQFEQHVKQDRCLASVNLK
ncbi:hypothetical protein RP20_CCG020425 [Aedes albopictus]|nr:hypothetical protein RP20_CCG020425 [Aedes albopictus]